MSTLTKSRFYNSRVTIRVFLTVILPLALVLEVQAQPTIVSTVPAQGATGVSPSAAVVFTFSETMDTTATEAQFIDILNPTSPLTTTPSWDASGKVLTCTPNPAFPSNKQIYWAVSGQNPGGDPLGDTPPPAGFFSTSTGGGGPSSGYGTNRITTFSIGKGYLLEQTSTGAPTLDTNTPFTFSAVTALASNRTATSITLTMPASLGVTNLTQNFFAKEDYDLFYFTGNSNTLETKFPAGSYTFSVTATASNQNVAVTLPPSTTQPPAPHVSNFAEAQSVNASQPFKLTWDRFTTGTAADYISVVVGAGSNTWQTADYGAPGALDGTATSVTIPAGTLLQDVSYDVTLGFYRGSWSSNATYAAGAYLASVTQLSLVTAGTASAPPVVSNPVWTGSSLGFDITTTSGQTLTVLSTTDCSLPRTSWQILLTTNSPGTKVHFTDPGTAKSAAFYTVRNGP